MSELLDFLKLLGRFRVVIIGCSLAFGLAGLALALLLPPKYEAVVDLYVKRAIQPAGVAFYSFDGYYGQQAAERYTDTVVGLLSSKGLLQDALTSIGWPTDQKSLLKYRRAIAVKKVAPQLVEVKAWQVSGEHAAALAEALTAKVIERARVLNEAGDRALSLEMLAPQPLVEQRSSPAALDAMVGVLVGFFLAVFGVALREYWRENR